jgi:hypothetical protein
MAISTSEEPEQTPVDAGSTPADEIDDRLLNRGREALRAEAALARALSAQRRADARRLHQQAVQHRHRLRSLAKSLHQRLEEIRDSTEDPERTRALAALLERVEQAVGGWDRMAGEDDASRGSVAYVLREDPDLADGLAPADRAVAEDLLCAPVLRVDGPTWRPPDRRDDGTYGLLLLDGLLARRLRIGRAVNTELLGCGDIIRPWDEPHSRADVIAAQLDWRVLAPGRLAILDGGVTRLMCRWPELALAFSSRLLRRARNAEYLMAVGHLPQLEQRLLATLWHFARTWGTVTPRGVRIEFRLTHELLGEIIGGQRPSVTIAIHQLERRGELIRERGGTYLLTGRPAAWSRATAY